MKNKRCVFACWAVFCISITSIMLKYDAKTYQLTVGAVVIGFLGAQSITDHKKLTNGTK